MGIRPYKLHDRSLEVNLLCRVVSRIAVVCGQPNRKTQNANAQSPEDQEFAPQELPPNFRFEPHSPCAFHQRDAQGEIAAAKIADIKSHLFTSALP
jgi:hypothetical protein